MALSDELKLAVNISQHAQRNYDLSKSIPQNDFETLLHARTKNKDVPPEFRNGDLDDPWRFGIRIKESIKVSINDIDS